MKNQAIDLRNHLFETMERLKSGEMDIATAKAMSEVGQTIINLAKVEVDAYRAAERIDVPSFLTAVPQPLKLVSGKG